MLNVAKLNEDNKSVILVKP